MKANPLFIFLTSFQLCTVFSEFYIRTPGPFVYQHIPKYHNLITALPFCFLPKVDVHIYQHSIAFLFKRSIKYEHMAMIKHNFGNTLTVNHSVYMYYATLSYFMYIVWFGSAPWYRCRWGHWYCLVYVDLSGGGISTLLILMVNYFFNFWQSFQPLLPVLKSGILLVRWKHSLLFSAKEVNICWHIVIEALTLTTGRKMDNPKILNNIDFTSFFSVIRTESEWSGLLQRLDNWVFRYWISLSWVRCTFVFFK